MQPAVTSLRATYGEEAVIDLVCLTRSLPAAELLSGLNKVHAVERGTGEVTAALKERNYDYLLDLHGTVRSRSLARALDVLTLSVDKQAWNRWTLIRGWRKVGVAHFVERCLDVLKPFGVMRPDAHVFGAEAWGALELPTRPELPSSYVAVALGSSHPGKHMSDAVIDTAIHAAQAQGRTAVLVGGEAEQARASNVVARHPEAVSHVGTWTLGETAAALAGADAVVTGDTVTLHLAAAVGTPVAAVWGCTRPSLGLAAWRPNPQSIDVLPSRDNRARPCSKHGATCRHTRSSDPFHTDRCGQHVDPREVDNWLKNLLT
jgi:heptosyltransferase-2